MGLFAHSCIIMTLFANTAKPNNIVPANFDVIHFISGHAEMWDSQMARNPDAIPVATETCLRSVTAITACLTSDCPTASYSRPDAGSRPPVTGRNTGWRCQENAYNAKAEMKRRGALYEKA